MSADVSLSRRVAAFPHDAGVLYAAIERHYDVKDGPGRARESIGAFGSYEACMEWIFKAVSSVASGMLLSANRREFDPAEYLASWKHAFRNPTQLVDQTLTIHADRSLPGLYCLDEQAQVDALLQRMRNAGFAAFADDLAQGRNVCFRLGENIPLAETVIGDNSGTHLAPWRVDLQPIDDGTVHLELAHPDPSFALASMHVPALHWYCLDGFERICFTSDVTCSPLIGWDYSIKQDLIKRYAQPAETLEGRGEEVIREVCSAMASLPHPAPTGSHLRCRLVDVAELQAPWHRDDWYRVFDKLRMKGRTTADFSVGDAVEADCIVAVNALARRGFCAITETPHFASKAA